LRGAERLLQPGTGPAPQVQQLPLGGGRCHPRGRRAGGPAITCQRAGLADGQRILELGCGWGSLSLWMAERYPGAAITAVSNPHSQRAFIEARATALGLANLRVITADMNGFEPQ